MKRTDVPPTKTGEEIIGDGPIDLSASAHYMGDNRCDKKRDSKHSKNQEETVICFHQEVTPVSYDLFEVSFTPSTDYAVTQIAGMWPSMRGILNPGNLCN